MRTPETSAAFSRPLRAVALLIGATSIVWELAAIEAGPAPTAVWIARLAAAGVAFAIAAASSPRRSPGILRAGAFALAIAISLSNVVVVSLVPDRVWEAVSTDVAVILGAALFVPWSWRWQASLAAAVGVMGLATLFGVIARSSAPPATAGIATADLPTRPAARGIRAALAAPARQRGAPPPARHPAVFEQAGGRPPPPPAARAI